jgi:calreticulin
MFGPDVCGPGKKKSHLIWSYKDKTENCNKDIPAMIDSLTHLYALSITPNNTYEVRIDNEIIATGNIKDDFNLLPPPMIPVVGSMKPTNWVDIKEIPDQEDKKPSDWPDDPPEIRDWDAKKPRDWDDELDGEWRPMKKNPAYKEWKPRMIPNPAYKGEWQPPMVRNPEFVDDEFIYAFPRIGVVGFELWQVESGSIFDNILLTDSDEEALKGWETVKQRQKVERKRQEAAASKDEL